uniref:Immunoglobulin V-set domain-containing protein n=1 Tax=Pseudonaja textilis TaxID=8673 RepID=A0A670ZPA8_PSETE
MDSFLGQLQIAPKLLFQEEICFCVQCQDRVDQKPVKVTKEGEGSTITYQFTSNDVYSMHWYRQYPRGAPELFLTVTLGSPKKHEHVSASFDRQKKESHLNIVKVKMKDAVVYLYGIVQVQ